MTTARTNTQPFSRTGWTLLRHYSMQSTAFPCFSASKRNIPTLTNFCAKWRYEEPVLVERRGILAIIFAQIQRSGFDFRRYHIFWEVVGLEWGPLSLVNTIEELLERNSSGSCLEMREYGRKYPSHWPRVNLYMWKLALTSRTSGGRSVGTVRSRTQATEFGLCFEIEHLAGCQSSGSHLDTQQRDISQRADVNFPDLDILTEISVRMPRLDERTTSQVYPCQSLRWKPVRVAWSAHTNRLHVNVFPLCTVPSRRWLLIGVVFQRQSWRASTSPCSILL
jgi:hypothetical protein